MGARGGGAEGKDDVVQFEFAPIGRDLMCRRELCVDISTTCENPVDRKLKGTRAPRTTSVTCSTTNSSINPTTSLWGSWSPKPINISGTVHRVPQSDQLVYAARQMDSREGDGRSLMKRPRLVIRCRPRPGPVGAAAASPPAGWCAILSKSS